jgi:hypothetical protein
MGPGKSPGTLDADRLRLHAYATAPEENAKYNFQPSVCASNSFVGKDKVGGDGSSANGWWVVAGGTKDINSPKFDGDYWAQYYRKTLADAGIDYKTSASLGSGYLFAWPATQVLEVAGQLDGGLNRTNLILATRALDMTHPSLLPGVQFNMSGNKDPYFVEGGIYQKYDFTKQGWDDQGSVIELSGKSKPCAWDQAAGLCK